MTSKFARPLHQRVIKVQFVFFGLQIIAMSLGFVTHFLTGAAFTPGASCWTLVLFDGAFLLMSWRANHPLFNAAFCLAVAVGSAICLAGLTESSASDLLIGLAVLAIVPLALARLARRC